MPAIGSGEGDPMVYVLINALAIMSATLVGLGAGTLYYLLLERSGSPLRTVGRARTGKFLILAFVAQFWLATILAGALILAPDEADASIMALSSAVVIWLGFVAPVIIVTQYYRELPVRTALIDCGHWFVVMLIQAVVLYSIGLDPPPV